MISPVHNCVLLVLLSIACFVAARPATQAGSPLDMPHEMHPLPSPHKALAPSYYAFQLYRGNGSSHPCQGLNHTLEWPVANTTANATDRCFSEPGERVTCVTKNYQPISAESVQMAPKSCTVLGFQVEDCDGVGQMAHYDGSGSWTWGDAALNIHIKSFVMTCVSNSPSDLVAVPDNGGPPGPPSKGS